MRHDRRVGEHQHAERVVGSERADEREHGLLDRGRGRFMLPLPSSASMIEIGAVAS
jgi:hypothetical protein